MHRTRENKSNKYFKIQFESTILSQNYYSEDNWYINYRIKDIDSQHDDLLKRGYFDLANRLLKLRDKIPFLISKYNQEFWIKKIIWKLPKHSKGYIELTIRPYYQGYGCDGTTDSNIHLLSYILLLTGRDY